MFGAIWWSIRYVLQHEHLSLTQHRLPISGTDFCIRLYPEAASHKLACARDISRHRLFLDIAVVKFVSCPHLCRPYLSWRRGTWGSSHACVCGWSDAPLTGSAATQQRGERETRRDERSCMMCTFKTSIVENIDSVRYHLHLHFMWKIIFKVFFLTTKHRCICFAYNSHS